MHYPSSSRQRPTARPDRGLATPPRSAALDLVEADGILDDVLSGVGITYEPARQLNQPGPPPPPFEIEPPPWHGQLTGSLLPVAESPPPGMLGAQALDALKARDDKWDPPAPSGPPVVTPPLVPVAIPQWTSEQRRAEQLARERGELRIAEELPQRHQPPKLESA